MSTIPKMQVINCLHSFNYPMPNFDFLSLWQCITSCLTCNVLFFCLFPCFSLVLSFFACTLSLVLNFLALIHTYQHSHVITCAHILVIPIHVINCKKPQNAIPIITCQTRCIKNKGTNVCHYITQSITSIKESTRIK